MKNNKRTVFALLLCVILTANTFSAWALPSDGDENGISQWARESVAAAYEAGLVSETTDLGEDYTRDITRLQFARLAVDFIAAEKGKSVLELADEYGLVFQTDDSEAAASNENDDDDTDSAGDDNDTAYDEAETEPDDTLSADELPELESGSFSDTDSPYAELALRMNIMLGSDGLYRPDDTLTRAEAAVVLQRCMTALGVTEADEAPKSFEDTYDIPSWAIEAVKFVSGRTDGDGTSLMSGASGLFSPNGLLSIEQAIVTILRMHASKDVETVYSGWRDAPGYNKAQITLTFGGDCTFGRGKNFAYSRSFDEMYDLMGPDYFFSGIEEFFNDDLTMVNFEGTLTNATASADKTYVFKGRPEYAQILSSGSIDVVTVANNHSMDYYQRGFNDTVENLSPYVAVSGYDMMPIVTVNGVNIGFASNVGWVFNQSQKEFIQNAVTYLKDAGADYIVFNYHWGIERTYHSNSTQQQIAHYCIDQGADLVIGHHPHVAQEVETYKGKQIAYSLGNLVFGGNQNPSDKNCLIFQQTLTFDLDTGAVVSESSSAIPYLISSVTYRNDYHPIPAN